MALQRQASEFQYRSGGGGTYYFFTVTVSQTGSVGVKDIQSPQGHPLDPATPLPAAVLADIASAQAQVQNIMATTSALNGTVTFSAESSKAVTFPSALTALAYRVYVSVPDFVPYRVLSRTTTGFILEMATSYTGTVSYDVFV